MTVSRPAGLFVCPRLIVNFLFWHAQQRLTTLRRNTLRALGPYCIPVHSRVDERSRRGLDSEVGFALFHLFHLVSFRRFVKHTHTSTLLLLFVSWWFWKRLPSVQQVMVYGVEERPPRTRPRKLGMNINDTNTVVNDAMNWLKNVKKEKKNVHNWICYEKVGGEKEGSLHHRTLSRPRRMLLLAPHRRLFWIAWGPITVGHRVQEEGWKRYSRRNSRKCVSCNGK